MSRAAIEKFFHDVSNDPALHRALLKRSRGPADFYPQAVKLAKLLGYAFTLEELRAWAEDEATSPSAGSQTNNSHVPGEASAGSGQDNLGDRVAPTRHDAGTHETTSRLARSLHSLRMGEQR